MKGSAGSAAGFTLVELMITVAVIAILAAVAYPTYLDQVHKGRRMEGRDALLAIAQAQERYYTVNGKYADKLSDLNIASAVDCGFSPCRSRDEGYYDISLSGVTTSTYTATATAKRAQAGDDCPAMTIDQLGRRSGTGDKCW